MNPLTTPMTRGPELFNASLWPDCEYGLPLERREALSCYYRDSRVLDHILLDRKGSLLYILNNIVAHCIRYENPMFFIDIVQLVFTL